MSQHTHANADADTDASSPTRKRRGLLRRLYDWMLHWAHTPYGTPALFLIAFAESSFFPIPPDPLLLALAVGRRQRAFFYGLVCTAGSVLGALVGYWIGAALMDTVGQRIIGFYHKEELFESLKNTFQAHDFWAILAAAVTPLPYKVFTIAAGAAELALGTFMLASVVGRGLRFLAEGALVQKFGAPIESFIDRYFGVLSIAFIVLLIGGFVVVEWLF